MIGIYGGTFDPIHIGHLILAQEVASTLGFSQVIFIPAKMPPWKESSALALHRYEMVRLAIENNPLFTVSDIELNSEETSYAFHTINKLKQELDEPLCFIIGSDNLPTLPKWHNWHWLVENCDWAIGERPDYRWDDFCQSNIAFSNDKEEKKNIYYRLKEKFIRISLIDISSTKIREKCAKKKSIRYLVPAKVELYIRQHNLYQHLLQ